MKELYIKISSKPYAFFDRSVILQHIQQNHSKNSWNIIKISPLSSNENSPLCLVYYDHPIYKNLGYLHLIDKIDCLEVHFIQPKYGIPASLKLKSYLFSRFSIYLHDHYKDKITEISMVNF